MIVYVLPSVDRFGGVKVGFQFAELLRSLGVPIVVATPGGAAPRWFRCSVPVVERERIGAQLGRGDVVLFSLPHDHAELAGTGADLVLHCQGTDPLIDPVITDPRVTTLTCWDQAHRYVRDRSGREPIDVGISIADVFVPHVAPRRPRSVAYMPRRGWVDQIEAHARRRDVELIRIEGDDESVVAAKMASAEVFAAVAEGEWFGLPALEAMASGCAVVSVPTIGGAAYLDDGVNAIVRPIDEFGEVLDALLGTAGSVRRDDLSRAGAATVRSFRRSAQRARLASALEGPLGSVIR